ncbi:endonuclease/exonuclease/phosphatase family protein [Kribbella sp. NPDC051586]|uniref:endonuclease/exonuclease/phosphatase family protein n=1 Tax=Kribbella sp. NPDC051586 TaxID=3364118 RepID=UPI003794EB15
MSEEQTVAETDTRSLIVGTWNLHGAQPAVDGPRTLSETLNLLGDVLFDVVLLQELEFEQESEMLCGESQEIVNALGLEYFVGYPTSPSQFLSSRRFGVGIASRFPLFDVENVQLPNPDLFAERPDGLLRSHDKGILVAKIHSPTLIVLGSVHLIPFHMFDREASDPVYNEIWSELAATMTDPHAPLSIVGGDFNTGDRGLLLERLPTDSWTSAASGVNTRPGTGRSFDDILCADQFAADRLEVFSTFSDHHLLRVRLSVLSADSG